MTYSVIICTYNRCELLKETILSILNAFNHRIDFEIIIIDNNSIDDTQGVSRFFENKGVKYYLETNQGLSFARNRGMKESNGDILVYLDDDIDIVSDYFDICDKIFSKSESKICGGKVLPYKVNIPDWLPEKYYYLVSIFDIGNQPLFTTYIMGGNFVIRKEDALKVGIYNTKLGRSGTNLMAGEENEYQDRAKSLGYLIEYKPELTIFHKIEAKLNKEYVLKYAYLNGKSSSILFSTSFVKHNLKKLKSVFRVIAYYTYGKLYDKISKSLLFKIQFEYSKGYLNGK